jgi:uncharacterized protein (TIGR02246 family)
MMKVGVHQTLGGDMRANKTILVASLSLFLTAVAGVALAHGSYSSYHGAQKLDEAFAAGMNANDIDALTSLYAQDATLYNLSGPPVYGRDAIRVALGGLLGYYTIVNFRITESEYVTEGPLSTGWALFTMTLVPKDGSSSFSVSGRSSVVAERRNGQWRYSHDHASVPMP